MNHLPKQILVRFLLLFLVLIILGSSFFPCIAAKPATTKTPKTAEELLPNGTLIINHDAPGLTYTPGYNFPDENAGQIIYANEGSHFYSFSPIARTAEGWILTESPQTGEPMWVGEYIFLDPEVLSKLPVINNIPDTEIRIPSNLSTARTVIGIVKFATDVYTDPIHFKKSGKIQKGAKVQALAILPDQESVLVKINGWKSPGWVFRSTITWQNYKTEEITTDILPIIIPQIKGIIKLPEIKHPDQFLTSEPFTEHKIPLTVTILNSSGNHHSWNNSIPKDIRPNNSQDPDLFVTIRPIPSVIEVTSYQPYALFLGIRMDYELYLLSKDRTHYISRGILMGKEPEAAPFAINVNRSFHAHDRSWQWKKGVGAAPSPNDLMAWIYPYLTGKESMEQLNRKSALTFYKWGKTTHSLKAFNTAIDLDPTYALSYNERGWLYYTETKYNQAEQDFNKSIELQPANYETFHHRALVYSALDKYEKSINDYSKAIELSPENASLYEERSKLYDQTGQKNSAEADRNTANNLKRVKLLFTQQLHELNDAIQAQPNDAKLFFHRGILYSTHRQYDKAITDFTKALQINPNDLKAYFYRGEAYLNVGRQEQANIDYKNVTKLRPGSVEEYSCYAKSYLQTSQIDQAIERFIADLSDKSREIRKAAADTLDQLKWQSISEADQIRYLIAKEQWKLCVSAGAAAVEPLLLILAKDPWGNKDIVTVLGQIGDPRAVVPLLGLLQHNNQNMIAVIDALGNLKDQRAIDPLVAILKKTDIENKTELRQAAVRALSKIKDSRVSVALIDIFNTSERNVQFSIIFALQSIGDDQAVLFLIQALNDLNSSIRKSAADSLGNLKDQRAVEPLINGLQDDQIGVRISAAKSLGQLKNPKAVIPLMNIYKEQDLYSQSILDPPLREVIVTALGDIHESSSFPFLGKLYYQHQNDEYGKKILQSLSKFDPSVLIDGLQYYNHPEKYPLAIAAAATLGEMKASNAVDSLIVCAPFHSIAGKAILTALGKIGDPRANRYLITTLSDPNADYRKIAALGLTNTGWKPENIDQDALYNVAVQNWTQCVKLGKPAITPLLFALKNTPYNTPIAENIIVALGNIKDPAAIEPLLEILKQGWLKNEVIAALGKIGEPVIKPLLKAWDKSYTPPLPSFRESIVKVFENINDVQAVMPLITIVLKYKNQFNSNSGSFVQIENNQLANAAIQALGRIKDRRAVQPLIDTMHGKNIMLHLNAYISLKEITGQELIDDWKVWDEWWKNQRR